MDVSDELLARYFKNQCTPEEKLRIIEYLNELDELPEHLLKKEEWDDAEDTIIPNKKSDEIFDAIKKQTITKALRLTWLKIISAAAIVLVTLGLGYFMINKTDPTIKLASNRIIEKERLKKIDWKSIANYTINNQSQALPDGSIVKMYPGAELRYALPFVKSSREIYLKGKAFFQVTKDKNHPFIVYAKDVSTTALGTSFTITASEKSKLITVELHTGKVWVKNVNASPESLAFSKILFPGSELVYNSLKNQVKVLNKTMLVKELPKQNELIFKHVMLKDVFEKLQQHYKIKIIYSAADVDEISFTGTINLNQKPEKILKEITGLTKLNQTETTKGYLIYK